MSAQKDKRLPQGAVVLAQEGEGRVYRYGDQVVVEAVYLGKRVETRLPADLEWLSNFHELLQAGCDRLAMVV